MMKLALLLVFVALAYAHYEDFDDGSGSPETTSPPTPRPTNPPSRRVCFKRWRTCLDTSSTFRERFLCGGKLAYCLNKSVSCKAKCFQERKRCLKDQNASFEDKLFKCP